MEDARTARGTRGGSLLCRLLLLLATLLLIGDVAAADDVVIRTEPKQPQLGSDRRPPRSVPWPPAMRRDAAGRVVYRGGARGPLVVGHLGCAGCERALRGVALWIAPRGVGRGPAHR